jgi:hypothetical protein
MENNKELHESENVSFTKKTKLLINTIGQNIILDLLPLKERDAYERNLQRYYKRQSVNRQFSSKELESPQWYCEQFYKNIEGNYRIPSLLMESLFIGFTSSLESILWDYNLYYKSTSILGKSKKEIVLHVLHEQMLRYIDDDSSKKDSLWMEFFKTSEDTIIRLLTDSFDNIFKELILIYRSEEVFYEAINNYCEKNHNKYLNLSEREIINYKQNIINWRTGKVYNPNWRTLVPVLDFLEENHITFVHRLIGLYLRKNAQKALADIFSIFENELNEIIVEIVRMIKEKKRLEEFSSGLLFDVIWFHAQRLLIVECLEYQNNYENNTDIKKSSEIIEYLKCNYFRSPEEKFLCSWLQTRARVFGIDYCRKNIKETGEDIVDAYKDIFTNYCKYIDLGTFIRPFLFEAMVITECFFPRRVKVINDYYEHGYACGGFPANKQVVFNDLKEFRNKDLRISYINIHHKHCQIKISPEWYTWPIG